MTEQRKMREEITEDMERQYFLITWKQFSIWLIGGLIAIVIGGNFVIWNASHSAASMAIEKLLPQATMQELEERLEQTKSLEERLSSALRNFESETWKVSTIETKGHSIEGSTLKLKKGGSDTLIHVIGKTSGVLYLTLSGSGFSQQWQISFTRNRKDVEFESKLVFASGSNPTQQTKFERDSEHQGVINISSDEEIEVTVTAIYNGSVSIGLYNYYVD